MEGIFFLKNGMEGIFLKNKIEMEGIFKINLKEINLFFWVFMTHQP